MKKSEITVGGHYVAKVSGKLVTVRVDQEIKNFDRNGRTTINYRVTNLSTGRKTTFRSAAKFRSVAVEKSNLPKSGDPGPKALSDLFRF